MLIAIRKILSSSQDPPIEDLANKTQLFTVLKSLIGWLKPEQTNQHLKMVTFYMKLEVTWILTNVTYGPLKYFLEILTESEICP